MDWQKCFNGLDLHHEIAADKQRFDDHNPTEHLCTAPVA